MKKMFFALIFAAIFIMVASCDDLNYSIHKESNPNIIPIEQALANVDALLNGLSGPATRTSSRRVASINIVGAKTPATRSGSNSPADSLFYLVNYANNQGFALLGADRRVNPIYAISDEGQFNLSDTINNPGLALFFQNATRSALKAISRAGSQKCSDNADCDCEPPKKCTTCHCALPPTDGGDGDDFPNQNDNNQDYFYPSEDWVAVGISSQVGPFISASVANGWKQTAPFNSYIANNYPTGSAALSVAMLFSYYSRPTFLAGRTFNWNTIRNSSTGNDNLYWLLNYINDSNNLNAIYTTVNGSPYTDCSIDSIDNAFRNLQVFTVDEDSVMITDFNLSNNRRPLILCGKNPNESVTGSVEI